MDNLQQLKQCCICKKDQPLAMYYDRKLAAKKDGSQSIVKQSYCKDCVYERQHKRHKATYRKVHRVPDKIFSPTQCAYLAALIDGEGTYGINHSNNNYYVRMSINMTGSELIDVANEVGLGTWFWQKRPCSKPNWKPTVKWHMGANDLRCLLPQIMPYHRFKKKHGEVVARYLGLSNTDLIGRSLCHDELRRLNKRGIDI